MLFKSTFLWFYAILFKYKYLRYALAFVSVCLHD